MRAPQGRGRPIRRKAGSSSIDAALSRAPVRARDDVIAGQLVVNCTSEIGAMTRL
jgi:hypothetical protein